MFPRYIVITTIVATFIAGGITQNESLSTSSDTNESQREETTSHYTVEHGSGGEDEYENVSENLYSHNSTTATTIETTTTPVYRSSTAVDSEDDAHINYDNPTSEEATFPYQTTGGESNVVEGNDNDIDNTGFQDEGTTSGNTNPKTDQATEDDKDCFSLMRPTVFTLLVLALCFICLLFIYTVVCSCFLARRRICDPESPQTIEPQKAKSTAKEKDANVKKEKAAKLEEARKKKESKKKEKAEKMEEAKKKKGSEKKQRAEKKKESEKKEKEKAKKKKDSEKIEKVEKIEEAEKKDGTEKEAHVQEKENVVKEGNEKIVTPPEETIELTEVSKGDVEQTESPSVKDTLGLVQEVNIVNEEKASEPQANETTCTGEVRTLPIPPPPPIDGNEAHPATTEVVVEMLPPPPPPEDAKDAQRSSTNENIAAACKSESEVVASTPESKTTETVVDKTADTNKTESEKKEDLANVEMKLDEVLEMLDTIRQ